MEWVSRQCMDVLGIRMRRADQRAGRDQQVASPAHDVPGSLTSSHRSDGFRQGWRFAV
ncbi:hypothetical protein SAMN05216570_1812 [Dyella sp. OK004]|uniref:hypothetical protein n=1 Tax=Dyella sp. OK004 TaxID=1855292 RepID=UPI0008EFE79A|nr:hypothetical protein [Dyella sp. OK004]SFS04198.1 hypothetical protein SAMN05216570_1812 [Dyella sp. OK004]